jgi:hypothetical protein
VWRRVQYWFVSRVMVLTPIYCLAFLGNMSGSVFVDRARTWKLSGMWNAQRITRVTWAREPGRRQPPPKRKAKCFILKRKWKLSLVLFFRVEHSWVETCILGAFSKLRRATISFVVSVRLSLNMEQLSSHWTDIYEFFLSIFKKCVKKIQFYYNLTRITGTYMQIPIVIW